MGKGPPSQRSRRARNRAQKGKLTSNPMLPVDVCKDGTDLGIDIAAGVADRAQPQPRTTINGAVIHVMSPGAVEKLVDCDGLDSEIGDASSKGSSHYDAVIGRCAVNGGDGNTLNNGNTQLITGNAGVSSTSASRAMTASAQVGELRNGASLFEIESQLSEVSESSCNNNNASNNDVVENKKAQLVKPGVKIHYGAVYYGDGDKQGSGVGYRPYRVVSREGSIGVLWIPATDPIWTIKKNLREMGFYLPDELAHVVFMYY